MKRLGVAQRRQERHSDGMEVGSSQLPPGTRKWAIRWKEQLGLKECPYVYRWRFESPFGSVRVHHWLGRDDDRAMHDHPWSFVTFILRGGYTEMVPSERGDGSVTLKWLKAPSVHYRPADYQHMVFPNEGSVWTVIVTGPRVRHWGFWVKGKFVKSYKYFYRFGHHPCD